MKVPRDTERKFKLIPGLHFTSKSHKCKEYKSGCICYSLALEPDEGCPIHGNPFSQPRCLCGRFVKNKKKK